MSTVLINQSVCIEMPDGFRTMSPEEIKQAYSGEDAKRWGAWDKEKHVMITVMWKDTSFLMAKLADLKAVCRRNEQLNGRACAGHDYQSEGFFSLMAGNRPAEGYRFSCRIGDAAQSAETVLIKHNKTIYSVTCTGRTENRNADREMFAAVLARIRFN